MIKQIIKIIVNFLNIAIIWLSIALTLIAIFKKEWIIDFIEWMKIVIEGLGYWNYLIAGTSSMIESFPVLWVVVPGQNILLIVWGFFGEISYNNLLFVILVASLWAIIWNYIWYFLWKYYWEDFFFKYWNWFGIGKTEVKYIKKWIDRYWAIWIILGKFHPMTRAFLPFIAWSLGMKSTSFMIYNTIWSIIRAIVIISLGVFFVTYYEIIVEYFGYIMMTLMLVIWLYIYKYKKKEFMKYMEEKNKEMDELIYKK